MGERTQRDDNWLDEEARSGHGIPIDEGQMQVSRTRGLARREAYILKNNLGWIQDALNNSNDFPMARWSEFLATLPRFIQSMVVFGEAHGLPMVDPNATPEEREKVWWKAMLSRIEEKQGPMYPDRPLDVSGEHETRP